jgi:hypothetical protein
MVKTSTGTSDAVSFDIHAPSISKITDAGGETIIAEARSGDKIIVFGEGFGTHMSLSEVVVTFRSETQEATATVWYRLRPHLGIYVPALEPGTYSITVTTTTGESNAVEFTIVE